MISFLSTWIGPEYIPSGDILLCGAERTDDRADTAITEYIDGGGVSTFVQLSSGRVAHRDRRAVHGACNRRYGAMMAVRVLVAMWTAYYGTRGLEKKSVGV